MARENHVRWTSDSVAKVSKMLAWAIFEHEKIRKAESLWARFGELLPAVSSAVLGEEWSRERFCEHIATSQGAAVSANMLLQRADKAQRYSEFNDTAEAVLNAYLAIVPVGAQPAASVSPSPGKPHPTRSQPQTNKPISPAIRFFKTLVRAARTAPGYATPESYGEAFRQAIAVLPWLPEHYYELRGEELGPDLYGTVRSTLEKYATGEGLSGRKRAELELARLLLSEGRAVGPEQLRDWLATAGVERAAAVAA